MTKDPFSAAEWKVMQALWAEGPATVRQVRAALPADCDWAYSTVKTVLDRLAAKGAVAKAPAAAAPGKVYRPLVPRARARRAAAEALTEAAFEGRVGDLVQFLVSREKLSRKERERLRRLLEAEEEA